MEQAFASIFSQIVIPEEIIEYTRIALHDSHKDENTFRAAKIFALNDRYTKLGHYISAAYPDKLDGKISTEDWESKTGDWKSEQIDIELKLKALRSTNTAYMLEGIRLLELAKNAHSLFQKANSTEKRELLNWYYRTQN